MQAGNAYTDRRFLSSGFQVFLDAFGAHEGVLVTTVIEKEGVRHEERLRIIKICGHHRGVGRHHGGVGTQSPQGYGLPALLGASDSDNVREQTLGPTRIGEMAPSGC